MSAAITEHPAENKGGRYFKYVLLHINRDSGNSPSAFIIYLFSVGVLQGSSLGLKVFYSCFLCQFALFRIVFFLMNTDSLLIYKNSLPEQNHFLYSNIHQKLLAYELSVCLVKAALNQRLNILVIFLGTSTISQVTSVTFSFSVY